MLKYARDEGKTVPSSIREGVARLCFSEPQPEGEAPEAKAKGMQMRLADALEVHGALCQLVAPATPVTLQASKTNGRLWVENVTVRFLLVMSILSLVAFLTTAILKEVRALSSEATGSSADASQSTNAVALRPALPPARPNRATQSYMDIVMLLAAAGLGSGFYGLYTAHKYIVNRTFNPKYNQIYVVRYVLGLTSGSILGYFGTSLLNGGGQSTVDPKQLGPPVLALVGGYAAEAVSQILQRIADTLVTIVRGSGDDALDARKSELEARSKQQEAQKKMELLKPLQDAKEALITQGAGTQPQAHAAVQKAIDTLTKP